MASPPLHWGSVAWSDATQVRGAGAYAERGQTDHGGRFRVETIRPAQYPVANAPPAHIHVAVGRTAAPARRPPPSRPGTGR